MASEEEVKQALTAVVHLPLDARADENKSLVEKYHAGPYFPVFILTDSSGSVIARWTGYTGAGRFLAEMGRAMSNLTTIESRRAAFEQNPTRGEALFLAKYYSDIAEFIKAADYYRRAQTLGPRPMDYSFKIFENYANAAWNDQISFGEVLPTADSVLASERQSPTDKAKAVQLLSKLARKMGTTDRIAKYLQAGIDAVSRRIDPKSKSLKYDLEADYALYVEHDTAGAVALEKTCLGENWSSDLDSYYPFGSWCYERGINLEEAQRYVQTAAERASDGPFKAKHLSLLSNICEARGFTADALSYAEQAVEQDPDNESYATQLERLREAQGR